MSNGTKVKKRDGRIESLDLDKIHLMVDEACKGLSGVSASQVEMQSGIQFYDGITTAEIQEILIRAASDLIDLDHPNYQYVSARLLLFAIRKQLYGKIKIIPNLSDHITTCVKAGVYDEDILNKYTQEEINKVNEYIDHDRDFLFTYAGLRQVVDKYLVQDRSSGTVYETPQFMYVMIALTIFAKYPKQTRLSYVKRYYDAISKHKINIPTPIMAGVRTPLRQFASCVLVDVDDTLDSIFSSDMAIGRYVAQRAGIGINAGRIRGINSKIRGGEVQHTGVIPFLKKFEATVRCCTQNGIRGGSATVHFPFWHQEIEDILVLKNNKGTEDNRVRRLDYSIQFSKIFYERFIQNGEVTLFSPHDVPGLYDAFGLPEFDELYVKYENDPNIKKKKMGAQEIFLAFVKERSETGREYVMNIDHCNYHGPFKDQVAMSNLCQEITLPTVPIQHIDGVSHEELSRMVSDYRRGLITRDQILHFFSKMIDAAYDKNIEGEIALCILSAINAGKVKSEEDLEELCDLAVRALEELIDYQDYPVRAAEVTTKARRSLGVGFIGLAHYLAKLGYDYDSQEAWDAIHGLTESFQYYLLKASNQLAKEKGACEYFNRTKYSDGILPIDTYKKEVDEITSVPLQHDWESLRASILQYGLRHSTLSAQMPSESSSVVSNATNGIEPPRDYLSIKKSKKGPLKQIVPQYQTLKNNYTLLWDMKSNRGYIHVVAVMQKFFDQAISGNTSYNPENYPNNEIPVSVLVNDLLTIYRYGWKTAYYQNTYDIKTDEVSCNDSAIHFENFKGDDVHDARAARLQSLLDELIGAEEDDCESCKI